MSINNSTGIYGNPIGGSISPDELSFAASTITTDTTLSSSNYYILVDATGGNVAVTVPQAVTSHPFSIKRIDGSANTVTVAMDTGNIDGDASVSLAQYDAIEVISDGSNGYLTVPLSINA